MVQTRNGKQKRSAGIAREHLRELCGITSGLSVKLNIPLRGFRRCCESRRMILIRNVPVDQN